MARRSGEAQKGLRKVSLHIGASFGAAWENVLLPWFQTAGRLSWQLQQPTLVAVPFRSHAYAIKGLLLDRGISLLGIRFASPAELRELLAARSGTRLALREHLRLLLSIAAEECMKLPEDPALREKRMLEADFLAAKSVTRAPDHLLRTIDQLGAAGWDFSAVELPALRQVEARFQQQLADCGFELIHTADRRLLDRAGDGTPIFANILVTGFNGAHWPLWPLLRSVVASAKEATVLLDDPRDEARDIDETWVGTWEESFGEAKPISPLANPDGDSLFTDAEMKGTGASRANSLFIVGADTTDQAEAIALLCVRFLAEKSCTGVGVIFAGSGALPRLVAGALAKFAVPHSDGFGHPVPGLFESAEWRAWLQLQRGARVNSLIRFLSALRNRDELFPDLSLQRFERTLRSAHAEVLIDDLAVLQEFADAAGEKDRKVARALQLIEFLPAHATFSVFLDATKSAFSRLNWKQHWIEVASRSSDWAGKVKADFSRALYLRWLEEIAATFSVGRDAAGDHPYARVQLMTIPQAQGQEWSHLILAGLNEGSWPSPDRGEFAREEEIKKFNRSVRQLNRRAARQGGQGEGHTCVRDGYSLYLGPSEQREIALRQFQNLLESATEGIAFTASLVQESAPERLWNPSELFTRHYQQTHHRALTQQALSNLQMLTRRWILEARDKKKSDPPSPETEPTRIAYNARRDPTALSREYDFAFPSNPPAVPVLSVSDFEQLLLVPALVWMKKYLGVEAPEESDNIWSTSTGKWVHSWLAAISQGGEKNFTRLPSAAEIEQRVCAAAEAKRSEIERLCGAAGKPVPDWWIGGWRHALFLARILAEKLATVADWPWMAAEWSIEGNFPVNAETLSLRGRIDLLLARNEPPVGSLASEHIWIIDYKTGGKKALSAGRMDAAGRRPALKKRLLDRTALQLGLYALAAGALGAQQTEVSLLSPVVRPFKPQVSGDEFSSEAEIFAELAKMQRTGVFGLHGPLRSDYQFIEAYPLATLAVEQDILEQRWEFTHPALVKDEEDFYS